MLHEFHFENDACFKLTSTCLSFELFDVSEDLDDFTIIFGLLVEIILRERWQVFVLISVIVLMLYIFSEFY